ncbi:MAG: hypothetical protein Tsb0027_17230 [Wenzhouxiangellaceae bacterium]
MVTGAEPEFTVQIHQPREDRPKTVAMITVWTVARNPVCKRRFKSFAFVQHSYVCRAPTKAMQNADAAVSDHELERARFSLVSEEPGVRDISMFMDVILEFFHRRDQLTGSRRR